MVGRCFVEYSPNGKKIVTAGADGLIKIWSVRKILERGNFEDIDRRRPKKEKLSSYMYDQLRLDQGPITCLAVNETTTFNMLAVGNAKHNTVLII